MHLCIYLSIYACEYINGHIQHSRSNAHHTRTQTQMHACIHMRLWEKERGNDSFIFTSEFAQINWQSKVQQCRNPSSYLLQFTVFRIAKFWTQNFPFSFLGKDKSVFIHVFVWFWPSDATYSRWSLLSQPFLLSSPSFRSRHTERRGPISKTSRGRLIAETRWENAEVGDVSLWESNVR